MAKRGHVGGQFVIEVVCCCASGGGGMEYKTVGFVIVMVKSGRGLPFSLLVIPGCYATRVCGVVEKPVDDVGLLPCGLSRVGV